MDAGLLCVERKKIQLIEDADILIAATALNKEISLVTDNQEHFKRVHGLKIHNGLM